MRKRPCVAVTAAHRLPVGEAECGGVLALKSVSSGWNPHMCLIPTAPSPAGVTRSWVNHAASGDFCLGQRGSLPPCSGLNPKGIGPRSGAGTPGRPATPAPQGPFVAVSAGYWHTCGIRRVTAPICLAGGHNGAGQATPPQGPSLGQRGDTTLRGAQRRRHRLLWGYKQRRSSPPPFGTFASVEAPSQYHTCGVRSDGHAICWATTATAEPGLLGKFARSVRVSVTPVG